MAAEPDEFSRAGRRPVRLGRRSFSPVADHPLHLRFPRKLQAWNLMEKDTRPERA